MANIFTETWHETVQDIKRVMPESIKEQLARNKYKYIAIVLVLLTLELGLGSAIWNYFSPKNTSTSTAQHTTNIKDGK